MKRSSSIQIKAAFLLMVFTLNTIVGFACTIGVDMNFNESHHEDGKAIATHQHTSSHQHDEKSSGTHKHDRSHSHDDDVADHHQGEEPQDDCCTEEVLKFEQVDKRAPQSLGINFEPVFFDIFFESLHLSDISGSVKFTAQLKYFVRTHHPPIPEIRIAIQSFQI